MLKEIFILKSTLTYIRGIQLKLKLLNYSNSQFTICLEMLKSIKIYFKGNLGLLQFKR